MKKQINFTLFKEPWTINFYDNVDQEGAEDGSYVDGWCWSEEHKIDIATKTKKGKPKSARDVELVKLHELVHCILGSGSYFQSNSDEPMVEWIAKCLLDLKEQKIL